MKQFQLNCPYFLGKLKSHEQIKHDVLDQINLMPGADEYKMKYSSISRCDFDVPRSIARPYVPIIRPHLEDYFNDLLKKSGYDRIEIHAIWFQQYTNGGGHDWHVHMNCQWTNVYYVDMPDNSPKTELLNPITKEIIVIDADEGSILTFPSFIIHRAPKVQSDLVKTIISFNSCKDFIFDKDKHQF